MDRTLRTTLFVALAGGVGWVIALATYYPLAENRNPEILRWLALVILATPLATFIGWVFACRDEWRLAAACCGALYFFTPFVAARIESVLAPDAARQTVGPHTVYFVSVLAIHLVGVLGLVWWRSRFSIASSEG
ncbi:MAG: hypothetical protein C0184_05780 [Chloroflexus aggregans]|uniref:Uncharacterized protein n=1 Tax=Chloroflexus aggregans TaxID=152260 RepID=A0A2J6X7S4_9CHLR|nr:MAG: hypothetical protein C0184_05780 [Chloroflexus aggregans]